MSLIAEFTLQSPVLADALAAVPSMIVEHEQQSAHGDGPSRLFFWANGGEFEAFERALDDDPSVTEPRCLATLDDRRLYRVQFSADLEGVTYPVWTDADAVLLESVGTTDGWDIRMRFPDRDALRRLVGYCREHDLPLTVTSLYHQRNGDGGSDHGLTPGQRQALVAAAEQGYFDVPRRATLDDVASSLGVSGQALSERIRRGTRCLVTATLPAES